MRTLEPLGVNHIRPEEEILLLAARTILPAAMGERLRWLIADGADWGRLLGLAKRHGMAPLLQFHLSALGPVGAPRQFLDDLYARSLADSRRSFRLTLEMLDLLQQLAAEKVIALPFKGPTLAVQLYGNAALRPFIDLDFLVRRSDFTRAMGVLDRRGFRLSMNPAERIEEAYFASQGEREFISPDGSFRIEIHWDFFPRYFSFGLLDEDIWRRRTAVSIGGRKVEVLGGEDLLLFLSAHGTKHLWGRLEWICCIAELVRKEQDLNIGLALDRARRLGGERMVLLGLALAQRLLAASLPPEVAARVDADRVVTMLHERVRAELFKERDASARVVKRARFHLAARERLRDRFRYVLRFFLTPTPHDWRFLPLPAWLFPLHALLRPLRILARFCMNLVASSLRAKPRVQAAPLERPIR